MAVVVAGKDAEHALEVTLVHDQEPIETLGADGADKTLGDRVRLRRSNRRPDDLDSFAGEGGVEVTGELAVAVANRSDALSVRMGEMKTLLRRRTQEAKARAARLAPLAASGEHRLLFR